MTTPTILAFGGQSSQTGLAVQKEFPDVEIEGGDETFDDIASILKKQARLVVLPMWNSHAGEITKSNVIEILFKKQSRLYRMWPGRIIFECLKRCEGQIRNIISVGVAKAQCSIFISEINAKFTGVTSTSEAYRKFKADDSIDAVLRAPKDNKDGFAVDNLHAENPLNFTTFVLLGGEGTQHWLESDWGSLSPDVTSVNSLYFGVQMPIRPNVLSDDQQQLLEHLMGEAETFEELPRVLFVSERNPGVCGLLIEALPRLVIEDILDEDGLSQEINIISDLGQTSRAYPPRAQEVIDDLYSGFRHDFVRHRGEKTCFFACPPLDIMTHGYDEDVVEPIVREIITKCFEMYTNGALDPTLTRQAFFDRHQQTYLSNGRKFIEFIDIGF